jgi:hypothetical protein
MSWSAFNAMLFIGISAGIAYAGWVMALRLAPEAARGQRQRLLWSWALKGMLLPLAIWAVMNLGLSWNLQAFMPQVQAAQNTGKGWAHAYFRVMRSGFFVITTTWTAVTLGWALGLAVKHAPPEAHANFKSLCWTCLIGMSLPALGLAWLGGWPLYGLAAAAVLAPIAASAPPFLHIKRRPPMYSRAIARMKMGKYTEAEWEIIRQLENCEDDFQGWMMLAELYATHFHDRKEAEKTVLEACSMVGTSASQLSVALHRLADWHLKLGNDPESARWALEIICERLKGSHLAHMAQLRINQLPLTARELREQQAARPIRLPALGDSLDEDPPGAEAKLPRHVAAQRANECVEKLKQDPNNVAARENLARLFTEELSRADLGIEQIGLLLEMPDQPESQRAEWWGLVAAWRLRYQHDFEAAREVLERLVREFPHTPQALAAQRRLRLIDAELRARQGPGWPSA